MSSADCLARQQLQACFAASILHQPSSRCTGFCVGAPAASLSLRWKIRHVLEAQVTLCGDSWIKQIVHALGYFWVFKLCG